MTDTIKLDVHAHLVPILPDRLAAIAGIAWDEAEQAMVVDGHKVGIKSLFKPAALLGWMAENRVEHAFISVPPPMYRQHLRADASRRWAAYLNDGLAAIAEHSDGKLSALFHLPTEDPETALALASEAIAQGHRRFAMPSGTGDERGLGDAEFEPLWALFDAAKAFVFFHPGECADGRLKSFYLTNLLGNPYESTVALAHLMFSGVLERYPNLTPCFAHGGGMLPMVAGRFERGFDTARPGIDTARTRPSRTLRGVFADCICHSEAATMVAEEAFGTGNIVFGSDWPFPMGLIEPHAQLASYQTKRRENYLANNPTALLARLDLKE